MSEGKKKKSLNHVDEKLESFFKEYEEKSKSRSSVGSFNSSSSSVRLKFRAGTDPNSRKDF